MWGFSLPTLPRYARVRALCNPVSAVLLLGLAAAAHAQEQHAPRHDYPTSARADYVIGCLAANGFQHRLLDQCSCSIDFIADQMSYDAYERAETILAMQQASVGHAAACSAIRPSPSSPCSSSNVRRRKPICAAAGRASSVPNTLCYSGGKEVLPRAGQIGFRLRTFELLQGLLGDGHIAEQAAAWADAGLLHGQYGLRTLIRVVAHLVGNGIDAAAALIEQAVLKTIGGEAADDIVRTCGWCDIEWRGACCCLCVRGGHRQTQQRDSRAGLQEARTRAYRAGSVGEGSPHMRTNKMIELVIVYCLVSDAKSCTEKRLRMEVFHAVGCTMSAQQRAQEYLQEHPTFMLKSWRCEVNVPRQNPA